MSTLTVKLQDAVGTIEGDAAKVLKFLTSAEVKITADAPKAIAGLTVVAAAMDKALNDADAVAANPTSIVLNFGSDVADVKAVWPAIKNLLATVGVKT